MAGIDFAGRATRVQTQIGIFGDTITFEGGVPFRSVVVTNVEAVPNFARDAFLKAGSQGTPAVFLMKPADRPLIPSNAVLHRLNEEWTMSGPPILESFSDVPFQIGQVCLLSVTSDLVAQPLNQLARILRATVQNVKGSPVTAYTPDADLTPCRVEEPKNEKEGVTANQVQATADVQIILPLEAAVAEIDKIAVGTEAQLAAAPFAGAIMYQVVGSDIFTADARVLSIKAVRS